MLARLNIVLAAFAAFVTLAVAGAAAACCAPPTPPCNCSPPPACCSTPGHTINVPNINVYVAPPISINVTATGNGGGIGSGDGGGNSTTNVTNNSYVYMNGGSRSYYNGPSTTSLISNLNVTGGDHSYQATRTTSERTTVRAACMDDKAVPHPASQVTPDKEIADSYDGEVYRCIAGTRMQYTLGDKTYDCQKGDALYHGPGGKLECRKQKPARDCNERSLLRRYGAGDKIMTVVRTETYTAHREEAAAGGGMSLDGGVGGMVY